MRRAPPGFVLAPKASRYLTHVKRLHDMDQGLQRLYERWQPLTASAHMGPVLWQLPANFHRDDGRLTFWLERLPPGRHTLAVRHESWMEDAVLDALRRHLKAVWAKRLRPRRTSTFAPYSG